MVQSPSHLNKSSLPKTEPLRSVSDRVPAQGAVSVQPDCGGGCARLQQEVSRIYSNRSEPEQYAENRIFMTNFQNKHCGGKVRMYKFVRAPSETSPGFTASNGNGTASATESPQSRKMT